MSTYQLEYAHSSRGKCAACKEPFEDNTLRVSAHGSGHHVQNRHLSCVTIRVAKNALAAHGGSVEGLPGFEGLSAKDRQAVQRTFGQVLKEDTKAAAAKSSPAPKGKRKAASPAAPHGGKRAKTGAAAGGRKARAGARGKKAADDDQGDKDEDMAEQGEKERGDTGSPVEGGEEDGEGAAAVEMEEEAGEEEQGSEGQAGDEEGPVAAGGKGGGRGKAGAAGAKKGARGAAGAKAAAGGKGRAARGKGKAKQEEEEAGAKGAEGQEEAGEEAGKQEGAAAGAGKQPGQGGVRRQGVDLTEEERQAPAAVGDSGTGTAPPDPRQEEQKGGEAGVAAGGQQQQGPRAKGLESLEAAEAAQAAEAVAGQLAEATIGPEAFEHRQQSLGDAGKE